MKRFIRVFVGVLALFVNAYRAVPVSENWKASGCIQCEGDTIPCVTGSCVNFEPPECGYKCVCPTSKTGVLCEQDKVYINVPVVKETVQVKINPIEGLNLPLFGPQANSDLFNNPPPVVNTNTNTNTKQTAMVNATTTAKSTTTTTATNATQSTKTGASKNSSPHGSQATSNSDQSTGASSTSGQSQDSSPNPSSSSSSGSDAASSGGSGSGSATGKKVTSTTTTTVAYQNQAGAQKTPSGGLDLGSVPSLSDALSLAHFDSPSYQNTSSSSSGNPSTDMISKLQRLYTGGHIGTSSSSTSSGVIPQQSDTNVSGSSSSSSSSSFLPKSSANTAPEASTATPQ